MNTNEQATVNIGVEDLLQILELANRLVSLGYASRTETNFIRNLTQNVANAFNAQAEVEETTDVSDEQNNKVDENVKV